ncbi:MAG: class I SAM-dependent methyltransferase [Nostoc sp. ChiSLP01]|nr:class I SAM-dependent methyltransferase [Nostoc sp. CmiSLP01]MDZ8287371.1 class I SAM-dependent methyltransferase [Nostoc sp. ChiSLP01]
MPRWTAQEKEAYRTEVIERITIAMPSVMQEYASINWAQELKGYRTDHEYYPDYIQIPIHGVSAPYTNPESCLSWDAAMDAIIPLSHNVTCQQLREKMAELIPQDTQIDTVLELGAGTAGGALALAQRFPEATFRITDVSPYMLVIAQHKFNKLGFSERASFEQVDARQTGYPDNSFTVVTSSLLFHETPKEWTPKILKEMYRVTKPGGWVLYADTYRGEYALNASFQEPWLDDFIHFNFEYEFAKAGFTELNYIRYAVGLWYMVGRKPQT